MKNIEKLIDEQQELKERLKRLIDFMNSEEFFTISEGEKSLLGSQRAGMEMYLNALTNRIYSNGNTTGFGSSGLLPLMLGMLSMSSFTPTPAEKELKNLIYEPGDKEVGPKE